MDRVAALSIEKYHRDAHSNVAAYVIYRIWNAVKAIFGRSDWQITRNGVVFAVKSTPNLKGKDPNQMADCYLKHAQRAIDLYYQFAKKTEIDENLFTAKFNKINASFEKEMGLT
jgi:hypothetical protein